MYLGPALLAIALGTIPDPTFQESVVHTGITAITGLGRAPDGSDRMFVIGKYGAVRISQNGVLLPTPFFTFSTIYTSSECGLIGMTFDPDFTSNHYVYFFVTVSSSEQQILRLTDVGNVGQDLSLIVGGLTTRGANHDGGGLAFGPDGKIYWSIGDNGNGTGVDADLTLLAAKVGRANADGSAPSDNPFFDGVGPNNDYIWARGFRNPYTMTFSPDGRLFVNVVGTFHEQVFVVGVGDHAGWNNFEANQPAGYITPIISYRTNGVDASDVVQVQRSADLITVTTVLPHYYYHGMRVTLAGVSEPSMNGEVLVLERTSPTEFSALQPGADATGTGGTAEDQVFGGCITGGTFYDSTSFSAPHRGAFFFGDYNSDNLMRATFDADQRLERVDIFGTTFASIVDSEVAADGSLWLGTLAGRIYRVEEVATAQHLVVTPVHLRAVEAGHVAFSVRLALEPSGPVLVDASIAGDADVTLSSSVSLSFDPLDWNKPKRFLIAAAPDADTLADSATVTLSAAGLASQDVYISVRDYNAQRIVLSPLELDIREGGSSTCSLALANVPTSSVTVSVTSTSVLLSVSSASVSFGFADYANPRILTLEANDDADRRDEHVLLTFSAPSAPSVQLLVHILDDDPPPPPADGGSDPLDAAENADAGPIASDSGAPSVDGGPFVADGGMVSEPDDDGCGCNAARGKGRAYGPLGLLALALLRRRQRPRPAATASGCSS